MKKFGIAGVALALPLAACGGSSIGDNVTTGNAADAAGNLVAKPDEGEDAASTTDVMMNGTAVATTVVADEFVGMAAASNAFEVQSAQLAETRAAAAAVKSYAAAMLAHHVQAEVELKAAAGAVRPAVAVKAALSSEQQANVDALGKAQGAAFDALYATVQGQAHENSLVLMKGYAARGDQPGLRAYAAKQVPMIEKHLADVRGLGA